MAVFEIPLQPFSEKFQISIGSITYGIRTLWNVPAQCWMIDIYDGADVPILTGTPLVTGADLLAQYQYLHLGNTFQPGSSDIQFVVVTTGIGRSPDEIPIQTNLGTDGKLFYVTEDL